MISGASGRKRPATARSVACSEMNWRTSSGGKIFKTRRSPIPTTRLVPVANTTGSDHGTPWLRAMSWAIGNQRAASERKARNAANSASTGDSDAGSVMPRSSIGTCALELPQHLVAALDCGVDPFACRFPAAEDELQFILDRVADQHEGSEPEPARILGRRIESDLLDRDCGS